MDTPRDDFGHAPRDGADADRPAADAAPSGALAQALLTDAFERVRDEVPVVLDGLTAQDLRWRPEAGTNSIGWLIWHLSRVQDDHLAGLAGALGRPRTQAWDRWRQRFGLPYPPGAIGYGQGPDEVAAFTVDDPGLLGGYHADVHDLTVAVLHGLGAADYARVIDRAWDPPVTAAARLVSVVNDTTAHIGQAAFLKGIRSRLGQDPPRD